MSRFVLLLGALCGALPIPDDEVGEAESAVRELVLDAHPRARAEHFALLLPPDPLAGEGEEDPAASAPRVVGVARWFEAERRAGTHLELELDLFELQMRVHHVERTTLDGPKLVWREQYEGRGRTVLVQREEGEEELHLSQWTGAQQALRSEVGELGLLFPLWLLERERAGFWFEGWLPVFDPLAARVEERRPQRTRWNLPGPHVLRRCRFTRRDGTPAGEWWFLGDALLAFRLQEGGPVALRVSEEEHQSLLRWGRTEGPP